MAVSIGSPSAILGGHLKNDNSVNGGIALVFGFHASSSAAETTAIPLEVAAASEGMRIFAQSIRQLPHSYIRRIFDERNHEIHKLLILW